MRMGFMSRVGWIALFSTLIGNTWAAAPGTTYPNPVEGDYVIKNFTFEDVRFTLPNQGGEPGAPDSDPKVSATITAVITLPDEINFPVDVQRVRATSDVFYQKRKMGELNIREWQPAKSTPLVEEDGKPLLLVESDIKDAPLTITDDEVFAEVLQTMLFRRKVTLNAGDASVLLKGLFAFESMRGGKMTVVATLPGRASDADVTGASAA